VIFAVTRTTWQPTAPLRLARRRASGQILAAAARMYVARWPLFIGIGLVFLPITIFNALLQGVVLRTGGEAGGLLAFFTLLIGTTLTLAGLGLVQAATASAIAGIDAGEDMNPLRAYRLALARFRALLGALAIAVPIVAILGLTLALVPVAVWVAVRWALVAQAVELEDRSALRALRRSGELVTGRWLKVAFLIVFGAGIALLLGPLIGALLILFTDAPFALLNIVAGVVYSLAMPLVALATTYVYYDAVVREELEPEEKPDVLPAEIA
jgi:hypothetical protein